MMRGTLARWSWALALSLSFCLGAPRAATAQGEPAPAANPGSQQELLVTAVRSTNPRHPDRAGLGDAVILTVQGLRGALQGQSDACEKLTLFLAQIPIPGSPPEACDPYTGTVRFDLDRTAESDKAWHTLLSRPMSLSKQIPVSVGVEGNLAFPTKVRHFEIEIVPPFELAGFLAGLALFLLFSFYLAKATPILRDRNTGVDPARAPYSLALFQLAFWSFLVIAAYLFIWLITDELDTITGSVLALLGIGSATALGSKIIDQGKSAQAAEEKPAPSEATAQPAVGSGVSRGFLNDILSDDQGISLYRFQLFAWTLVLGVIFCSSVYDGLEMPQFSPTLLGLMGISSGTYLGFKVPESSSRQHG